MRSLNHNLLIVPLYGCAMVVLTIGKYYTNVPCEYYIPINCHRLKYYWKITALFLFPIVKLENQICRIYTADVRLCPTYKMASRTPKRRIRTVYHGLEGISFLGPNVLKILPNLVPKIK